MKLILPGVVATVVSAVLVFLGQWYAARANRQAQQLNAQPDMMTTLDKIAHDAKAESQQLWQELNTLREQLAAERHERERADRDLDEMRDEVGAQKAINFNLRADLANTQNELASTQTDLAALIAFVSRVLPPDTVWDKAVAHLNPHLHP